MVRAAALPVLPAKVGAGLLTSRCLGSSKDLLHFKRHGTLRFSGRHMHRRALGTIINAWHHVYWLEKEAKNATLLGKG